MVIGLVSSKAMREGRDLVSLHRHSNHLSLWVSHMLQKFSLGRHKQYVPPPYEVPKTNQNTMPPKFNVENKNALGEVLLAGLWVTPMQRLWKVFTQHG